MSFFVYLSLSLSLSLFWLCLSVSLSLSLSISSDSVSLSLSLFLSSLSLYRHYLSVSVGICHCVSILWPCVWHIGVCYKAQTLLAFVGSLSLSMHLSIFISLKKKYVFGAYRNLLVLLSFCLSLLLSLYIETFVKILLAHSVSLPLSLYLYIYMYIYICCEVIIWSKFGVFKCYYLVQVGVFKMLLSGPSLFFNL